ncbi:MAG: tetratricopeptide repeat protein [Deltaproteobacteria bacterium]|jgi:tetratricopeptide (TPR) repeat protein|nr:tetratricopeptide repeat protein [Deltaproteobacteria bacterium]
MSDDPDDFTARIILGSLDRQAKDLLDAGDRAGALEILRRERDEAARLLGPDAPELLSSVHDMAAVMLLEGDPQGAAEILAPAIEKLAAILGDGHENHPDYLKFRGCHGRILSALGEHGRAVEILLDVAVRRLGVLDEGDLSALGGLLDLAAAQRAAGDLAGAGKTYVRARQACWKHVGALHELSFQAVAGEAECFLALGDIAIAEKRYRHVCRQKLELFGDGSEEAALCKVSLARILSWNGKKEEASALLEQALGILEKGRGPGSPETSGALAGLAAALSGLGRHGEAVALMREKLADREGKLGADHEATLAAAHSLGLTLDAAGESEQARAIFERTLERSREILGPNHELALIAAKSFGTALMDAGELDRAEELFGMSLEGLGAFFGPDHPDVRQAGDSLDEIRRRRMPRGHPAGRGSGIGGTAAMPPPGAPPPPEDREAAKPRATAEKFRARSAAAVEARKAVLGEDNPETVWAALELSWALMELGDPLGAGDVCAWAVPAAEKAFGRDSEITLTFLMTQGMALGQAPDPARACPPYEKALAGYERLEGAGTENWLAAAGCLAAVHMSTGEFQEAADLLSEAVAAGEKVNGTVHPLVVNLSANLGEALLRLGRHVEGAARLRRAREIMERDLGPGAQLTTRVGGLLDEARAGLPELRLSSGAEGAGGSSGENGDGGHEKS